jgi:hypothetical protein
MQCISKYLPANEPNWNIEKFIFFFILSLGHRFAFQRTQSRTFASIGPGCEKIGSVFGVWRCNVNFATMFLYVGRSLVGLHLVLHWSNRCRQWGEIFFPVFLIIEQNEINLNRDNEQK